MSAHAHKYNKQQNLVTFHMRYSQWNQIKPAHAHKYKYTHKHKYKKPQQQSDYIPLDIITWVAANKN